MQTVAYLSWPSFKCKQSSVNNSMDHPVEVLLTENIRRFIRTVLLTSNLPNDTRDELRKYGGGTRRSNASTSSCDEGRRPRTIPFQLLRSVHDMQLVQGVHLHELLEGSDVHLPEPVVPPRDPELEARVQRLKAEQMEREYQKMTSNVECQKRNREDDSLQNQMHVLNTQLISVFNFIVTVGGSFAFAYKATEYSMETPNYALQLCAGLCVATIVFIADLYFLIKYST